MKVFEKLCWFFKREKKCYIVGVLMLSLVTLIDLIRHHIIGRVIDSITEGTLTPRSLTIFIAVLLITAIFTYIFRYYWRILIFGASHRLGKILRKRMFSKFSRMSPYFYQERRTGDLMAHATNDIRAVQNTAGPGILTI